MTSLRERSRELGVVLESLAKPSLLLAAWLKLDSSVPAVELVTAPPQTGASVDVDVQRAS